MRAPPLAEYKDTKSRGDTASPIRLAPYGTFDLLQPAGTCGQPDEHSAIRGPIMSAAREFVSHTSRRPRATMSPLLHGVLRHRAAFGVLMTVLAATACGDDKSSTSATTMLPQQITTTTTAPATTPTTLRTVALGETFSVGVGESVTLRTEGLSLTYKSVVSDNRCRPTQQCIQAGDASVAVGMAKDGISPATLTIGAPGSARYGKYTVAVVQLGFGQSPSAKMRVS